MVFAGDGPTLTSCIRYCNEHGLQQNVRFLGKRMDIERLYQGFDICILPSFMKGFPVVGVEALTSGLPVVFSDQITNELNYCDYVRYLPLDLFSWVEVLKAKPINTKREEGYLFMKEHGFDIRDTVKTLEAIYDEGISAR